MSAEAKVGLFVLAGIILLTYLTFQVGGIPWVRPKGYTISVSFDSVADLEPKASVKVAGVEVGRVEKIFLEEGRAVVVMRIHPEVRIPADSSAQIRTRGLLGEKYVEIVPGGERAYLEEGARLREGVSAADIDVLVAKVTAVADDMKAVTTSLRRVFGTEEGEKGLRNILDNLGELSRSLREIVADNRERIDRLVTNADAMLTTLQDVIKTNRPALEKTLRNLEGFSETINRDVPSLIENLNRLSSDLTGMVGENRENVKASVANIRRVVAKLDESLDSLSVVVKRLEKGEGTIGKLLTDETAYQEMKGAASSIRKVTERLEKGEGTIGKLLTDETAYESLNTTLAGINRFLTEAERFRTFVGFRAEYQTDEDETKGYFTLKLQPREDKFYLFEIVDNPRGDRRTVEREIVTVNPDGTVSRTTVREVKREDEVSFTLLYGRRFGNTTLKAGLMENTFGLGLEQAFWNDRLVLSFDAYDFSSGEDDEDVTHLTAGLRFHFFDRFFISTGVDDMLSDDFRTFFIGGGLMFSDEDIKFLLRRTPLPGT